MNIEQVELFHIRIPLVAPFETSFGVTTDRDAILAKVTTADGVVGWGEFTGDGQPASPASAAHSCVTRRFCSAAT